MSASVDTGLDPAAVAAFLRRHPDFLSHYPDLAETLAIPRDDGQTTSLSSYQIEVLRDKNREISRRLRELVEVAHENEQLLVRVHTLTLALMRAASPEQAVRVIAGGLSEDFQADQLKLMLFLPAAEAAHLPEAPWLELLPPEHPRLRPFQSFLERAEPLCGRLHPDKLAVLFGDQAEAMQSTVLMALGGTGILALGSTDPGRFHPGMGTVFLKLLGEVISTRLQSLRHGIP